VIAEIRDNGIRRHDVREEERDERDAKDDKQGESRAPDEVLEQRQVAAAGRPAESPAGRPAPELLLR
jgi:hypothetical protein